MRRYTYHFILAFIVLCILACLYFFIGYAPARASIKFGAPADHLSISKRIELATRLLSYGDALSTPLDPNGIEKSFSVSMGESPFTIADRLQSAGIISDSAIFLDYLIYTGADLTIQAGDYVLSPAQSMIDIARTLQQFSPSDATLVILPGWRMEEIAASLPTSGLAIDPQAFLSAAQTPPHVLGIDSAPSMEGFFLPDTYVLPRDTSVDQLLDIIARNFSNHITDDLRSRFAAQGLDVYQAVTLASIVERESIHDEEQPLIAAVFINRLNNGWTLGSDPTVQYALGYDPVTGSWWKNPLTLADLKFDSPYNTYVYSGLPPAPISNPSLSALNAVANAEASPYFYFRAACDGSGYHTYAVTLEEQIANECP
jgi:UPF0755 protein